jgi:hypothetical protein
VRALQELREVACLGGEACRDSVDAWIDRWVEACGVAFVVTDDLPADAREAVLAQRDQLSASQLAAELVERPGVVGRRELKDILHPGTRHMATLAVIRDVPRGEVVTSG